MNPAPAPIYAFGPFRLDLQQHLLFRDEQPLAVTAKAFEVLAWLVRHHDRVVEKEELLAAVWPDAFVSEDSLTQAISMLRKAMGEDSTQPSYIATVPRRGYRFVATVTESSAPSAVVPEDPPAPEAVPAPEPDSTPAAGAAGRRWSLLWFAAAAAVVAIVALAGTAPVTPRGTPLGAPIRFVQAMPAGVTLVSAGMLSPDGQYLTFAGQNDETGTVQLWLRPLDQPASRAIPGTEGALKPFWSPDSRSIGFFAEGRLKRVGVNGTPPQTLASVGYRPAGGSWSSQGVILYADRVSRLYSVPDNGGTPAAATELDGAMQEFGHNSPHFLPDGRHFLFATSGSDPELSATYIGTLGTNERVRLLDGRVRQAIYAAPGHLMYLRDNVLFAQRFDADALRLTGAPMVVPVAAATPEDEAPRVGQISASANGLLAFGGSKPQNRLVWFSRDGRELETLAAPPNLHNPVLSPDGRSLIAEDAGVVWLLDLDRGAPTRLLNGGLPAWSADGQRVVFSDRRDGVAGIYQRSVVGRDDDALLVKSAETKIAGNWTPDGKQFVFASSNPQTRLDLWTVALESDEGPRPFLRSPGNELHPQISPDGRWLAYTSDESGQWEVYLQSFPAPGLKRTISVGGGAQPQWRRDGRELYYLSPRGILMSVDVRSGAAIDVGRPKPLFRLPIEGDIIGYRNQYAVAADGARFVVDAGPQRDPLNVVVTWNALVNP